VYETNLARFAFLDPAATDLYPDWDAAANITAELLRTETGRTPHDQDLAHLVDELCDLSDEFRTRWANDDVRLHLVVGDLDFAFEAMPLPADPGLIITAYSAVPGTATQDGVRLLAAWAATHEQEPAPSTDRGMEGY
jgi:hypothetical protein